MREFYVLGVVEGELDGHIIPTFRYLSVHVSRNKAFRTARDMINGANGLGITDHSDMRMYEHEVGDRMVPDHFYLIRTKAGEVQREYSAYGGGTHPKDESIRVLDYQVGMTRTKREDKPDATPET